MSGIRRDSRFEKWMLDLKKGVVMETQREKTMPEKNKLLGKEPIFPAKISKASEMTMQR